MDGSLGSRTAVPASRPASAEAAKPDSRKLGLIMLTGVVVGSMIGGGSFNLPQNMASAAGLGAVAIAWGRHPGRHVLPLKHLSHAGRQAP